MKFITYNHRFALDIVESNFELKELWDEIRESLLAISDERLIAEFGRASNKMSLSDAINRLIDEELVK